MATIFFDTNGTTAGFGDQTANWGNGASYARWTTNSTDGTSATAAWTPGSIAQFGSNTVAITGGTVTIPTANTISLNGITLSNCAGAQTIGSLGTGGLSFTGTNALISATGNTQLVINAPFTSAVDIQFSGFIILNNANTFTATATHSSGTLTLGNAAALGTAVYNPTGGAGISLLDVAVSSAYTITNGMIITSGFSFVGSSNLIQSTNNIGFNNGVTIAVNANKLTLGGLISNFAATTGAITLTSSGSGVLELTNGSSTFTGGATLTTGILRVSAGSIGGVGLVTAGPVGTGAITFNGGYIDASGNYTLNNALTISNSILMYGATASTTLTLGAAISLGATRIVSVGGSSTLALTGNITGATFGITKQGTGALTLSGTNTFSGSITVNAGTLSATNASSLGSDTARALTVGSGGTLSLGVATTRSSFSTSIAGTGVSTSGAISIANAGTNNLGPITLTAAALIRATSAGTLANTITNGGFALTLAGSAVLTVSEAISGVGALRIGISGSTSTVTLSGASTYTGNTFLDFASVTVSGSLGLAGTYTGAIAIAAGTSFGYNSATATTLSGVISGLGSFTKNNLATTATTITNTNTFSGVTTIQAGIVSVAVLANGGVNQPLGTSATLAFGQGGGTGTLRYTGTGGTVDKVVNLAGSTTGGATIENNGSGALVFTSAITGVSASGTRTLTLAGINASVNDFQGVIAEVGGGAGLTAFTKAGVGYWKLTGVNTFTGTTASPVANTGVSVTGGQLEIAALTALGSGTKTISVSTSSARNASTILSGASVTYPATLSWSLTSIGANQTNEPMGAIRALAASTISGTVTLTASSAVYADQGDLTLNGLVAGSGLTFISRAGAGRTVTINGGVGVNVTLQSVGPGITVWTGSASNATTTAPTINGGTLRMVTTTSTAALPLQFAFSQVNLGSAPNQTTNVTSRYQYTGGTLELSNSGATGAVSYTGLTSTLAINLARGSGTLRLLRDSAQNFTVTLGSTSSGNNGVLTLEYGGSAGAGTIGTDSSIVFSALTAGNPGLARTIISDGAAMVPVQLNASKVAIPMVYNGTQNNVAASQAGGATLTTLSTSFGYYNLTANITAQVSARINNVRLAAGTMTLAAGAILQTQEVMDVGIGAARTIIAGASGAKLGRNIVGSSTLSVYTNNVTGTGATISADVDARFNANFVKAGSGILTLSGAVANLSGINIAEGTFRIGSAGTFDSTFGTVTLGNIYAASGTTVAAEFNQSGDVVVAGLSGGGANTKVTLNGGDLVIRFSGSANTFGGNIVLNGSQKLKVKSLATNPEGGTQSFQGAFPFTAIEMSRSNISLDTQYGATVTGTPSITATGGSVVVIYAANPLEADYTVNFGALTVTAGALQVRLASATASTNPYATRISAASLTISGDAVALLLNQTANVQQTFAISGISAGPMGNSVNVYNLTNLAYYRTAGQTFAQGGTVPAGGSVDAPNYSATGDANFPASKTTGASFTSSATDNVNVATIAITAQNSVTVKSLRTAVNITMATGQRLTTDAILSANTFTLAGGEIATQTGSLYIYTLNTGVVVSSNIVDGTSPTKLILLPFSTMTLSGTNSYSGGTLMQGGGNITLSGASPLGTGPIVGNGGAGFTIASGTLTFGAGNTVTLNDGGLRLDASAGAAYALNGAISGTGDLYLTGAGTFTLGAVGTGNGALRMSSSSIVTVNAAQAFTEYDFNNSLMTFRYGTGVTQDISAFVTKRPGNTYRIDTNGQSVTWASSVGNGSTYIKVGDGTHTLGAENFFASATIGNNNGGATCGTVVATFTNALGYGTVTVKSGNPGSTSTGTALYLSGNITLPNAFSVSGEGVIGTGLVHSTSGSNTISGTVTLVTGVTTISRFSAAAGATLTLSGSVTTDSSRDVDFAGLGTTVVTGIIANGSGLNTLIVQRYVGAGAGTTKLLSANTYTRGTTISEGTIQAGNVSALGTGAVTLGASGTLQTLTASSQNGKLTITGTLTNSAGGTIRIGG